MWTLLQFNQLSSTSYIEPKPRIEGLSERGLDSVEEGHCVRDTVEGQSTCLVIQVNSYSGGLRAWYFSLNIIVSEPITITRALETPGLVIVSKCTIITCSADVFIWDCCNNTTSPLNLPVTASRQTLSTQNLTVVGESVWMVRIWLDLACIGHLSVPFRQRDVCVCCVCVQCEMTGIWEKSRDQWGESEQ